MWAAWSVWSSLARGVLGVGGSVRPGLFGDGLGGRSLPDCRFCPVVMGCRPLVKLGTSQRLAVWRVAFVGAERSRDTPL